MNTLPTNYVDAVYSGNKKYAMITNGDGTVSFTDQTSYTTQGTRFGAADVNAINSTVNELAELLEMTWTRKVGNLVWLPESSSSLLPGIYVISSAVPLDNVKKIKFLLDEGVGSMEVLMTRTYSSFPSSPDASYVRQIFSFRQTINQNVDFTPQSNEKYMAFLFTTPTGTIVPTALGPDYEVTYQAMKLR